MPGIESQPGSIDPREQAAADFAKQQAAAAETARGASSQEANPSVKAEREPTPQEILRSLPKEQRREAGRLQVAAEVLGNALSGGTEKPEDFLKSNAWFEKRDEMSQRLKAEQLDKMFEGLKPEQIRQAFHNAERTTTNPIVRELLRGAREKYFIPIESEEK
ncbi:hypothetical protein C4553_02315 [Candidatus Parcubacteria bacterium]|nr:MAG: hypothetical protein C4553_02315 [Candidatus Parcubacteria bacterium]